jgi:hypothetical protein
MTATIRDWIHWGLIGGRHQSRHPLDTYALARVINRDLELCVAPEEVHRAMLDAGFTVADRHHYLAEDTRARDDFERLRYQLWDSRVVHPLLRPDYAKLFEASEYRDIVGQFLIQFVRPCVHLHPEYEILEKLMQFSGVDVPKDVVRGALMANGMRPHNANYVKWKFHAFVDEKAFHDWRVAKSEGVRA